MLITVTNDQKEIIRKGIDNLFDALQESSEPIKTVILKDAHRTIFKFHQDISCLRDEEVSPEDISDLHATLLSLRTIFSRERNEDAPIIDALDVIEDISNPRPAVALR